jgi:hypothetical protein
VADRPVLRIAHRRAALRYVGYAPHTSRALRRDLRGEVVAHGRQRGDVGCHTRLLVRSSGAPSRAAWSRRGRGRPGLPGGASSAVRRRRIWPRGHHEHPGGGAGGVVQDHLVVHEADRAAAARGRAGGRIPARAAG